MKTLATQQQPSPLVPLTPAQRKKRLDRLQYLTKLLDEAIEIPGTNIRAGLDGLVGLVPGIGDVITALISVYLIYEAQQLGASRRTIARMLANVGIDAAVGSIPLLGDLFDVAWKANKKNLRLLQSDLQRRSWSERAADPAGPGSGQP